jgi:hypothetical protein
MLLTYPRLQVRRATQADRGKWQGRHLSNACREQIIATSIRQVAQAIELGWSAASFMKYVPIFPLRAILRMFKFIPDEFVVTFSGCWEKVNRAANA